MSSEKGRLARLEKRLLVTKQPVTCWVYWDSDDPDPLCAGPDGQQLRLSEVRRRWPDAVQVTVRPPEPSLLAPTDD